MLNLRRDATEEVMLDNLEKFALFYDADGGTGGDPDPKPSGTDGDSETPEPLNFETWHEAQPEPVKILLQSHVAGLKSALTSERDARTTAEKAMRDAASKMKKDSDEQKELLGLADDLQEATVKADFYEQAHDAGVTNLQLAYLAAKEGGLFDGRGNVNFEAMKLKFPELFGTKKPAPPAHGGEGGGDQIRTKEDMNQFIRREAGRSR
jgi:hypothetical protein